MKTFVVSYINTSIGLVLNSTIEANNSLEAAREIKSYHSEDEVLLILSVVCITKSK